MSVESRRVDVMAIGRPSALRGEQENEVNGHLILCTMMLIPLNKQLRFHKREDGEAGQWLLANRVIGLIGGTIMSGNAERLALKAVTPGSNHLSHLCNE